MSAKGRSLQLKFAEVDSENHVPVLRQAGRPPSRNNVTSRYRWMVMTTLPSEPD